MRSIPELRAAIAQLEAEISELKQKGVADREYQLDSTRNRVGETYHRLRWFDGETGKRKSRTLKEGEEKDWREKIDRNRLVAKKQKELERVRERLEKAIALGRELGLL